MSAARFNIHYRPWFGQPTACGLGFLAHAVDEWGRVDCPECLALRHTLARRGYLMTQALHNPEGMTKYAYTKGMTKADAMEFWNDATALGFVKLGRNNRGTNVFGLRSEVAA